MTADERLDQLEPLLSEALTVLDRHTYQLKRLSTAVNHLSTAVGQQGDNIGFLLREQMEMKGGIAELKGDVAELKGGIAELKGDMAGVKTGMVGVNSKLDLLIQLIQGSGK